MCMLNEFIYGICSYGGYKIQIVEKNLEPKRPVKW